MAISEACDRLWAAPTIDQESSAYTYTGRRTEWRTKVSRPTVTVEDTATSEQPKPRSTTTQASDLPPAYEDIARYGNWILRFNNAFARRTYMGGKTAE
jgi:hypothetical protein